jgi:hypothetical protein
VRILLEKLEDESFNVIVAHTRHGEGPTRVTQGVTARDVKAVVLRDVELVKRLDTPRSATVSPEGV